MPPPLLYPFPLFGLLFRFPLGKLSLSFLALEKRLYLREQDPGQGFHFMVGYPGAVVVDFFLPCHGSRKGFKGALPFHLGIWLGFSLVMLVRAFLRGMVSALILKSKMQC